jgi:hypothetical protein
MFITKSELPVRDCANLTSLCVRYQIGGTFSLGVHPLSRSGHRQAGENLHITNWIGKEPIIAQITLSFRGNNAGLLCLKE